MSDYFFSALWPGLLAWCLLYASDYALTVKSARLYRSGCSDKIVFEGSYELTPYFEKDVDSLRRFSPRFLVMLLLSATVLSALWYLSGLVLPEAYRLGLGAMILLELTIHVRHLQNLSLFRAMINTGVVRGRIEYSRVLTLQMSRNSLLTYSALYLLLFGVTQNLFLLGGALGCLGASEKHNKLARKCAGAAATRELQPATSPSRLGNI